MTKSSRYAQQTIITQTGTMKLGSSKVFELSEVELTEFHCRKAERTGTPTELVSPRITPWEEQ